MTLVLKYIHNWLLKFPDAYRFLQDFISSLPLPIVHEKLVKLRYNAMLEKKTRSAVPYEISGGKLLLDVTSIYIHDGQTGIQRVAKNILYHLLKSKLPDYTAIPVYIYKGKLYYSKKYEQSLLGTEENGEDYPVVVREGDMFVGLDYNPYIDRAVLEELKRLNCAVKFVLHDMLPLKLPQCFERRRVYAFKYWLKTVCEYDGAICVSETVSEELKELLQNNNLADLTKFKISRFCEGADIKSAASIFGLPPEAEQMLRHIKSTPTFIMVGKIEPRKHCGQALSAFEILWQSGINTNLVIVGAEGWLVKRLIKRISTHSELNKRLFWLRHISDEYLEKIYECSTCLIFASVGEGFGLPIVEAARHGLPIIARDLPVFKETAGENVFYFSGTNPEDLARAVKNWLELYKHGTQPTSNNISVLSWKESAAQFLKAARD